MIKMEKIYCECPIYLSNGEGKCIFCDKSLKPIIKKVTKENEKKDTKYK